MQISRALRVTVALCFIAPFAAAQDRAPRVSFEVLINDPLAQQKAQRWHSLLDRMPNVSARIRSGRNGERLGIEEVAGGYRVTATLDGNNRLQVPGGRFTTRDQAKIEAWISKLQGGGTENLLAPRIAFGLTPDQLTKIHDRLAHVVEGSTQGKSVAAAATMIAKEAGLSLQSDPNARAGAAERVDNEAKGLAAGAALAMVLRPGGLVLVLEPPTARQRAVGLRIRRAEAVKEFWPVGWPVQGVPGKLAADMFKRLDVEIQPTPLNEALEAVAGRLTTPLAFDHNAMVREGIDPASIRVTHPAGNTYYKRIIDRMLSQAKLSGRWRQDEAGKVFYWITTVKQAVREESSAP